MAVEVGDIVTADILNALRPTEYTNKASGTVAAGSTNVDVPGCTVTFDVLTNGAQVKITGYGDFDVTGTSPGTAQIRPYIDGVASGSAWPIWSTGLAETSTGRWGGVSNTFTATLNAGSHTVKLVGTTGVNIIIGAFTTLTVKVSEVI